jgi:competence protein ComEA
MAVRGVGLLLLLMLSLAVYDLGRSVSSLEDGSAFVCPEPPVPRVLFIDESGRIDGIHQINDARGLLCVINLAGLSLSDVSRTKIYQIDEYSDGISIEFQIVGNIVKDISVGWMPAAMRIALAIPLVVERMNLADWDDLPGAGPALAQRIIQNCQKNGEFRSFWALKRVKGIGEHRLERWQPFFLSH